MKEKTPLVTVLLPVYNCAPFVSAAVDSILNQTFSDFELLIIDDASTDETLSILKNYGDSRIKIVEKPANSGLTDSLNWGIRNAKGRYIARMDGDDISAPTRFEVQAAYLEKNPNVLVCGSWIKIMGGKVMQKPENHDDILTALLYTNPMAHPSVMMRRSAFKDGLLYDRNTELAEDYDLWRRLILKGSFHNIPIPLLEYRVHQTQVSTSKAALQRSHYLASRIAFFENMGYDTKLYPEALLVCLFDFEREVPVRDFVRIMRWIRLVENANNEKRLFPQIGFGNVMNGYRANFLKDFFRKNKAKAAKAFLFLPYRDQFFAIRLVLIGLKKTIKRLMV